MIIKNKKVAILGDLALDFTCETVKTDSISLETGNAVDDITSMNIDGAASINIAQNLKALKIDYVDIFGVIGDDFLGNNLIELLNKNNIGTAGIVIQKENWSTLVYHKFYDSLGYEYYRCDTSKKNKISTENKNLILKEISENINQYDCLVINQQFDNSIIDDEFLSKIQTIIKKSNIEVFFDTRRKFINIKNIRLKLNEKEAKTLSEKTDLKEVIKQLYKFTNKPVVITRGLEGAIGFDGKIFVYEKGIQLVHEIDSVGAGDAFLAGLVFAYLNEKSFEKSIQIANVNASISSEILHRTGHPTLDKLLTRIKDIDYRYNPELALDIRKASFYENTDIEIINKNILNKFTKYPKIAIFDHDGTLSTMRQSWEKIMSKMMIKAILEDKYNYIDNLVLSKIQKDVDSLIEKTTGIQTILQMAELIKLIKRYGYISPNNIKTPIEYKDIYKELLNSGLEKKYEYFNEGLLSVEDLTIKDAISNLKYFREKGIKIFLASGSDKVDVEREVNTFGYSKYFNGGIFGSVGDIQNDPKKKIMKDIISKVENKNVVVFGDGPVEMREGHKNNFLTVGLVSNEQQRFGINISKRERLILAGADVLIPDFSWMNKLSLILGWKK